MPSLLPNFAHSPTVTRESLSISTPYSATALRSAAVSSELVIRIASYSRALLSDGNSFSNQFIFLFLLGKIKKYLLSCRLRYRHLNVILDGDVGPGNGGRYGKLFRGESIAFADLVEQDLHRAHIHFRQVANAALSE